jgi:AcrR family transcriptional regulator
MSMRDLSHETGLSTGALYAYFPGKDELLEMLQKQSRTVVQKILLDHIEAEQNPVTKLRMAIRAHLYLSELMQPWFYFSYMETKNLSKAEKEKAIESELYTETIFADILKLAQDESRFVKRDHQLIAGVIKAMLQDWYLKRWKFAKRNVSVDQYADFVIEFVETYCMTDSTNFQRQPI